MADPKNLFNFGTGNIDKDQWLRDIDNGLDDFINLYGNSFNKHRTALLREAFADLRRRIANGDMLNRDEAGNFNFASALNREDKHMADAYAHALGFMSKLARSLVSTPPAEEPKKKYDAKTLNRNWILYNNPSGKFFTSNWNKKDEASRKAALIEFLQNEKKKLDLYGEFEGYDSKDALLARIDAFINNPNSDALSRIGFNLDYINPLIQEGEEKEKTEAEKVLEALAQDVENDKTEQAKLYLKYKQNKGTKDNYDLVASPYNLNAKLLLITNSDNGIKGMIPTTNNAGNLFNKNAIDTFLKGMLGQLDSYFDDIGVRWKSIYQGGELQLSNLLNWLGKLFSTVKQKDKEGKDVENYAFNWNKYFTQIGDNLFLINGSVDTETGRYAYYEPGKGIKEVSILDVPNLLVADILGFKIPTLKEGGKINSLQNGGGFDYEAWAAANNTPTTTVTKPQEKKSVSTTTTLNGDKAAKDMDVLDWAGILTPAILDLTSMVSANVPGYGTAISAATGIGSTLWNTVRDWQHEGATSGLTTLGTGLAADTLGLIPGWGSSAKLGKIAKGLSKYAKYIGPALTAKGFSDAAGIFNKWMTQGSSSLTKDDVNTLVYGLVGLTSKGTAGVKRANRSNLERAAVQLYNVFTRSGKNVTLNAEQLAKLRAQHKVKKAIPVVTSDGLLEANDLIMNASKWPIFGSVSLNRLEKMLELRLASKRNITRNTIWKPAGKGEYEEIPAYKPTGLNSQDWGLNILLPDISKKKSLEKFLNFKENYYKKKEKNKASSEKYGGVLKALRNGGIIKALLGTLFQGLADNYDTEEAWNLLNFGVKDKQYFPGFMKARWDNRGKVLDAHSTYGEDADEEHIGDQSTLSARMAQQAYYQRNAGADIWGDVTKAYLNWMTKNPNGKTEDFVKWYNGEVDWLRDYAKAHKLNSQANTGGWSEYNQRFNTVYGSYAPYDKKLEDIIGESTWQRTPNTFNNWKHLQEKRYGTLGEGNNTLNLALDNSGHLFTASNTDDGVKETTPTGTRGDDSADSMRGKELLETLNYKDPFDPSLLGMTGLLLAGIWGNNNIYNNLLKEMPQAPLRNPIDRKLAIVGNQRIIDEARNRLGDLRKISIQTRGSDSQVNFAKDLETERIGREIFDNAFRLDAERQFTTALKSWDLDNDDYLKNNEIHYLNDKAMKDRLRMIAQIKAAHRSGNANLVNQYLSDVSNWRLKKYQREQDLLDRTKELQYGDLDSYAKEQLLEENGLYKTLTNKLTSGQGLSQSELAQLEALKLLKMRELRLSYALGYYNLYHNPRFGGSISKGLVKVKDGGSLEKEKLKLRGKDNDRYVKLFTSLRNNYTRRRRR